MPEDLQRIGLRFINRLVLSQRDQTLKKYLRVPPRQPHELKLPFVGVFQQDLLDVTGYPYRISISKAFEMPSADSLEKPTLIIDIDVFTSQSIAVNDFELGRCLLEMRWLKNKAFFGTLTEKAKAGFS